MVCPFYGKNEDYCDVGCGYISPCDVETIIHFCSDHFDRCPAFAALADQHPEYLLAPPPSAPSPAAEPVTRRPSHDEAPPTSSSLAALGLISLGASTALFSLQGTETRYLDSMLICSGIFYGSLCQLIVGILAWKRHPPLDSVTFTAYGVFWLALLSMHITTGAGFAPPPRPEAMIAYLILWGLFSLTLLLGKQRGRLAIGSLALFAFLSAVGLSGDFPFISRLTIWTGLFSGFCAIATGLRQLALHRHGLLAPTPRNDQARQNYRS